MINTEGDTHPDIIENQEAQEQLDHDSDYIAWVKSMEPNIEKGEEDPKPFQASGSNTVIAKSSMIGGRNMVELCSPAFASWRGR